MTRTELYGAYTMCIVVTYPDRTAWALWGWMLFCLGKVTYLLEVPMQQTCTCTNNPLPFTISHVLTYQLATKCVHVYIHVLAHVYIHTWYKLGITHCPHRCSQLASCTYVWLLILCGFKGQTYTYACAGRGPGNEASSQIFGPDLLRRSTTSDSTFCVYKYAHKKKNSAHASYMSVA